MQLTRKRAKRLLDLRLVGIARDAEHFVRVAGRCRASHYTALS
jgi:hypothetical protein